MTGRRLVSVAELSHLSGIEPRWIDHVLDEGAVPVWRCNGRRLVDPDQFAELGLGLTFLPDGPENSRNSGGISARSAFREPELARDDRQALKCETPRPGSRGVSKIASKRPGVIHARILH